jgi:hypothetical protein
LVYRRKPESPAPSESRRLGDLLARWFRPILVVMDLRPGCEPCAPDQDQIGSSSSAWTYKRRRCRFTNSTLSIRHRAKRPRAPAMACTPSMKRPVLDQITRMSRCHSRCIGTTLNARSVSGWPARHQRFAFCIARKASQCERIDARRIGRMDEEPPDSRALLFRTTTAGAFCWLAWRGAYQSR